MKILLIAGHGAGDPGAVGIIGSSEYREANLTRAVVVEAAANLKDFADVSIYPTNRNAFSDCQTGQLLHQVSSTYDLSVEVHFNAGSAPANGCEVWVPRSEMDRVLAAGVCDELSNIGFSDRGVKAKNWCVIKTLSAKGIKSILVEVCFITSPTDMEIFNAHKSGKAIANAIINTYGLEDRQMLTYTQFKEYMDRYLDERATSSPGDWSEEDREQAQTAGIINDGRWKSWVTREELATVCTRMMEK